MKTHQRLAIACLLCCACFQIQAQKIDSTVEKIADFPNRLLQKLKNKEEKLDAALTRQTEKYLEKLARKEQKLKAKLARTDSAAAARIFDGPAEKYKSLEAQLKNQSSDSGNARLSGEYQPYADSLSGSLNFLAQQKNLSPDMQKEVATARQQFNQLQSRFQSADQIKAFIQQRKQQLNDQLSNYVNNLGLKKYLDDYNKETYYLSEQVRSYKEMFNDPDKMEQKALELLNKLPAFQDFMKSNSQLAGLFNIPGNYGTPQALEGLQTRDQVMALIQNQVASGGSSGVAALQSSLSSAHQQLDQFKDKLGQLGGGSADMDMPDFTPNKQKTKSFWKRLELGTNLQTQHASYYFPTTTDFGLSLGYKINNGTTVGIGLSYKVGWGTGINHIAYSSEGASLRSFIDVKAIKNFYLSGGLEYNYQQPFNNFRQVSSLQNWQQSGLIGISKMVSLTGKIFKKTKLQLLWDFLSYYQTPRTEPIKFRVGYNF